MNLFEAKRIAERNGFKVIKESEDKTVPPWAKKKMTIDEAREIVENAGYKVISEAGHGYNRGAAMGIQGNGMNGSPLASLAEDWISGQPCKFETVYQDMGLEAAKAEFIQAVEELEGSGVSDKWSKSVAVELGRRNNLTGCLLYLNELMQGGQGRSRWGKSGRRWC